MGTPEFALPALEATRQRTELALVVTQPDRPAGRGRKLHPPPVKEAALAAGLDVAQPERSLTRELGPRLDDVAPDVIVVAAFGKFLGRRVLGLPRHGCVNVHASLLPRWRGASPPVWAILAGDAETGVTVQRMVEAMDAGDVLASRKTLIGQEETAGELTGRLARLGAEALVEVLEGLESGRLAGVPQDHDRATLAPPLRKQDGLVDWAQPAHKVHDHVRAMNPWPMAFTVCGGGTLRILRSRVASHDAVEGPPGLVLRADRHELRVACGRGAIDVLEAQREGRCACCAADLVAGRTVSERQVLGA